MYCICIESSHEKGMGHLFRGINFANCLIESDIDFVFALNNDLKSCQIIEEKKIKYEIVDLEDLTSEWESKLIDKYKISTWIDDRLCTAFEHSLNVKNSGSHLVTFDNMGPGAELADIHVAALPCIWRGNNLSGGKLLSGIDYLVLNQEINKYRRLRTRCSKILVVLGGSDTHGITIRVAQELINKNINATILLGPSFSHHKELTAAVGDKLEIKNSVASLMKEFSLYDLAITGGGLTAFEANASGLPCIIIANEPHEIINAEYLEDQGCSAYAGFRQDFDPDFFYKTRDVLAMSQNGLQKFKLDGAAAIFQEIKKL